MTMLFGVLPLLAFAQTSLPSLASRLVGAFVRTVMTIAIGSIIWTKLGLFTWLTAVLVYAIGLGIGWIASHQWRAQPQFAQLGQQIAIATIDIFDRGISAPQLRRWCLLPWHAMQARLDARSKQLVPKGKPATATARRQGWSLPLVILTAIVTIAIISSTVWLRFEHPLTEFRYSHPDTYGQLLLTQQILARDLPTSDRLPIFASLAAFISALSGVHPIQVVHLLGAIVGTTIVLSIGYTCGSLTKNGAATLAATYSLGSYLFTWQLPISTRLPPSVQQCLSVLRDTLDRGLIRTWAVGEVELGALFAILAIGCSTQIARASRRTEALINTLCCVLLVGIIAPDLLILLLFAGFGSIFGRQMAFFTVSVAWVVLGVFAAIPGGYFPTFGSVLTVLPIGLSLLVGLLFSAIATAGRLLLASWSAPVCLTIFIAVTLNFSLPPVPAIDYLEYDATARKAVEIGHLFPHHQWTLVAPVEQLAQVYGRGWYEDIAQFTAKYQERVASPSFNFPHQTTLLVITEKQPFILDKPEYPVPYSVLVDPTYRNYRSPSGRTKLAAATLQLCETYRRYHPDSRIYYENDRLRIYQFRPQANALTAPP
ncbi:hypothetical protein [Chamaesiphon sp. OTE_20_metabat_361]|uniref:hypothetical protein n=1 Tax=Chamaesiphon sp. OTE_20_metabat_361 TaxID=2964689 RepID=UPI00286A9D2F|nr:hypothetical protein [Chamaesiphon sp. OTE_20_metabat_361]